MNDQQILSAEAIIQSDIPVAVKNSHEALRQLLEGKDEAWQAWIIQHVPGIRVCPQCGPFSPHGKNGSCARCGCTVDIMSTVDYFAKLEASA